ncbi:MAG: sensor histidine kinase, partial [Gaiellaceae bacterium]
MRKRLDPQKLDLLLAGLLVVGVELQVWLGGGSLLDRAIAALVGAAVTGSVAVRRRFPTAVGFGVQGLLALDSSLWGNLPAGPVTVGWFCALYALTVWTTFPRFLAGLAFFAGSDLIPEAVDPDKVDTVVTFTIVAIVVMVLVRRVLGDRDRRLGLAERERDLAAREAIVEERARIARELHDAIAHNVSMMVVQAGAERRVLDGASGTREVLETIERIGRGALTEMRRLVGMLRSDAADPLAPQPSLHDLPMLVAQVHEAGLPVELRVEGERRELPVGIELSAYRIVQEALTNALKHAGDAQASVHVRYGRDLLELEIVDNGAGEPAPVASGGHGLVGMRERVALYGGRLDA